MSKSKKKTKAERDHLDKVSRLGCLICNQPANIHHCGTYMGGGRDDMKVIPLCHWHHQNGGYGIALHAGKNEWQRIHGTEEDLLIKTNKMLNKII